MQVLTHKIDMNPTPEQETYFRKAFGTDRFAYNWALETSKKHYEETGESLSGYDLSKKLNAIKKEKFPWMSEVSKCAPQNAVHQFGTAMKRFFKKTSKFPRYKKKGKCKASFRLDGNHFAIKDKEIRIAKLGFVSLTEELRFPGRPISATVSQTAGRWFVSIAVELEDDYVYPHRCESKDVCGVDLGVRDLAVLDDGTKYPAPRSYRANEKKLKVCQRNLSRKKKGSKNRDKAKMILATAHWRAANARKDYTHKVTTQIVETYRYIGIEDLSVSGMLKNHKIAKSIQDAGFYEFRRQLEYKAKLSGSTIVVADRFFPSTKMCCVCKEKKALSLSDRNWQCGCGAVHDRDINAAINLRELAAGWVESINARGEERSGSSPEATIKLSSEKQEKVALVAQFNISALKGWFLSLIPKN